MYSIGAGKVNESPSRKDHKVSGGHGTQMAIAGREIEQISTLMQYEGLKVETSLLLIRQLRKRQTYLTSYRLAPGTCLGPR